MKVLDKLFLLGVWGLAIYLLCSLNLLAQDSATQEWTSFDGKSLKGQFVRIDGKSVVLKLPTGKEVNVKLSSLSFESHLQALKLSKPEAFGKDLLKVPEKTEAAQSATSVTLEAALANPFGENPTIDSFLQVATSQWKRGNPFISWHMLPTNIREEIAQQSLRNMEALGTPGRSQLSQLISSLSKIATEKREWILGAQGSQFPFLAGAVSDPQKQWPYLVGFLQKLSEAKLWQDDNFNQANIEKWLASMSLAMGYLNQMHPEKSNIAYEVVSQSADSADVEVTVADQKPVKVTFQKQGNLWIVPEAIQEIESQLQEEKQTNAKSQGLTMMSAGMSFVAPVMKKLAEARTRQEFDQALASSGIQQMMGAGARSGAGGAGDMTQLPAMLTGLPWGLPGFPKVGSGN